MRTEVDAGFAAYVRAREHQLLRAAYLVCGDAQLAEDLLQGALVKLALRWDRIRSENPDAFVRRILYRDAISAWRKTRREQLDGLPHELVEVGDQGNAVALRVDVRRALLELTPKQRAVVVLRYFDDRSEAATADVLGVSVGTVKSQTHAALARLRVLFPDLESSLYGRD
jgi:RNA polymerase sigma-70 factor (sigma-E family)